MADKFTCPRRDDMFAYQGDRRDEDTWHPDRGTCSYCGSISPEAFFEAIELGAELGPTDKSYKVYVTGPDEIVRGGARQPRHSHAKFYFQHLDEDGKDRFLALLKVGTPKIGYPGHFYRLPFFIRIAS